MYFKNFLKYLFIEMNMIILKLMSVCIRDEHSNFSEIAFAAILKQKPS